MQIEPTSRCEFMCRYCPRESIVKNGEDLPLDAFKRIVDRNPFVVSILIQGLGEPLLHQDLEEMVRYGRSSRIHMGICTHGTKLKSDRFDQLIRAGLNYLAISIDGTGESYKDLRGGADFELMVKHLSYVKETRAQSCLLAFWMRLSQRNLEQVFPVLELAKDSGVDHIHIQDLQYKHHPEDLQRLSLSSLPNGNSKRRFLASTRNQATKKGIVSTFDPMERHRKRTHCRWPWERIYVDCRGDVWPCCVAWDEAYLMGNILETPLPEIWHGSRYRRFRIALRDGPLPSICTDCRLL